MRITRMVDIAISDAETTEGWVAVAVRILDGAGEYGIADDLRDRYDLDEKTVYPGDENE